MGTFQVEVEIGDLQGEQWERLSATVGTRATFALVPRATLERLGVEADRRIPLRHTDGRLIEKNAGQTWLRIGDKSRIGIVIFGEGDDPVLVGMNTLQGMLLEPNFEDAALVPVVGLMPSRRLA